jgi:ribosome-associated translation inhibitor RaiA
MDREIVIPFGNLLNACAKHGMKARLYIFDGGETVEVSENVEGRQVLRVTAEHGDPYTASEMAAKQLMERGLLTMFDFEG